jgi:mannitol/fructose-specific phosphotransferase system IIA component (Ntr-type)
MKLLSLLSEEMVLAPLKGRSREAVLEEMVEHLRVRKGDGFDHDLLAKLLAREELGTTAIGAGIAIPHCKIPGLKGPILLLGLSRDGVAFGSVDGRDAHAIFLLVSPLENPNINLRVLAAIAKLARGSRTLAAKLVRAPSAAAALEVLRQEEDGGHA